ncbi:MAG: hypothetical protein N2047_04070 [Meiothermus sp.]|nr:hypothetical protein [Meiothermus sp.]
MYGVTKTGYVAKVGERYGYTDGAPGIGFHDYDATPTGESGVYQEKDFIAVFPSCQEAEAYAAAIKQGFRQAEEAHLAEMRAAIAARLKLPFRLDGEGGAYVTLPEGEVWVYAYDLAEDSRKGRAVLAALNAGFRPVEERWGKVFRGNKGDLMVALSEPVEGKKAVPLARESQGSVGERLEFLLARRGQMVRAFAMV